jgi:trimeric autotransporter adhesin
MKISKFYVLMIALFSMIAVGIVSCGSSATFATVSITPANAVAVQGTTQQFTATETLSDNSMTLDMTSLVTWASSNPAIATIDANGLVTAVTAGGPVTITATDTTNNIKNTAQFSVAAAALNSIVITSSVPSISIASGQTSQFAAAWNGGTPDITKIVTWISSDPTIATIDANGLAKGVILGSVTITATYAGITSPGVTLTVTL